MRGGENAVMREKSTGFEKETPVLIRAWITKEGRPTRNAV